MADLNEYERAWEAFEALPDRWRGCECEDCWNGRVAAAFAHARKAALDAAEAQTRTPETKACDEPK